MGFPACALADCSEIADEQALTCTLNAPAPKRKLVIASVCVTEVSPVEATVITGLPMIVSSEKKLAVLEPAAIVVVVI